MDASERLIVVIDPVQARAADLKDLIEFMDAPVVCVASPGDWRSRIGERRLAAVFLGQGIPDDERDRLIGDIGDYDPNVSIVLVGDDERN